MKGEALSVALKTKLYFTVFILFAAFAALVVYNSGIDTSVSADLNSGGFSAVRPHLDDRQEELTNPSNL